MLRGIGATGFGGGWALKGTDIVHTMISRLYVIHTSALNQPPELADDWYIGILKNVIKLRGIYNFSFSF